MPSLLSHLLLDSKYSKQLGSVLDLGCGTGLLGVEIHKNSSYLEGIDLSAKMLHEAKQKNVYDTLKKVEIVDYLARSELNFDFFIATDVFIYVGDLLNLFRLIKERNNRSGKLVFSTEHIDGAGYAIKDTGRFAHSKEYIQGLSNKFGYELYHFSTVDLRKENGVYIKGGLYILSYTP